MKPLKYLSVQSGCKVSPDHVKGLPVEQWYRRIVGKDSNALLMAIMGTGKVPSGYLVLLKVKDNLDYTYYSAKHYKKAVKHFQTGEWQS